MQGDDKDTSVATAACIDAETLAAWADGGLSKSDAAAVEVHLADCDRCTAMLATFARTIPVPPAAESLWTRWHLRWLVPVATAATVAALWVLIPRPESPRIATVQSDQTAAAPSPAPAEPVQPEPAVETKEQQSRAGRIQSAPADTFAKREESRAAPQPSADARQDAPNATQELPRSQNETVTLAPPSPPREADTADKVIVDAQKPIVGTQQSERFSPPAPAASPAAPAAAAPPAVSTESLGRARAAASTAVVATPITLIVSPDPMTRWRVVGAGQVERSTSGGARWEAATMPESATVTAGSSPSPSICWLVGRAGAIYVTTDGRRFTRVPFDEPTDFLSIQATDGRRATVVTSDGRRMRTEDQGATWIRISP